MKKYFFNKPFIIVAVIILAALIGIKVYSLFTFPTVSDNNFKQLQKIDTTMSAFSFAVFGDNKNSHKVFMNLIDSVNHDSQIKFAIDIGDLVYDGDKEKFRYFLDQIAHFKIPFLTVVGNHDIREKGRAVYYDLFGPFYYSFHVGNALFIILDDANEIQLEASQLDWLKKQFKNGQHFKYKFVFFHVPFYDPRKKAPSPPLIRIPILKEYEFHHSLANKNQVKKLLMLFKKFKVTHIYASHIHAYYRGKWGDIPFTLTGGAGAELVGNNRDHDFYHYLKITINNTGYHEQVIKLPTPDFEILDRLTHDAWIYIYSFFAIHFVDSLIILELIYLGLYILFLNKKWLYRFLGRKKN